MMTVVPSLPASSFEELAALARALDGTAPELQVDIVDGQFVPAVSWPFNARDPRTELLRLAELPNSFALELDCMTVRPEQYLDVFVSLGVNRVVVHMGSTECYADIIEHARTHGYALGLAFTNDVPLPDVFRYIDSIDFVQIMGIREVGKQGQPFDARTLETARALRAEYPQLAIAVDGSVNKDTIPPLKAAGVTRLCPGSAIAKQPDPKAAYEALVALAAD